MPALANLKHELFAIELAAGAPVTSAYVAAGYPPGSASYHNARRLWHHEDVKIRVAEILKESVERARISREYVDAQVAAIMDLDPLEVYAPTKKGLKLRPLNKLPTHVRRAINKIDIDEEGRVTRLSFGDKIAAAGTLLRSLSGTPDVAVTNNVAVSLDGDRNAALDVAHRVAWILREGKKAKEKNVTVENEVLSQTVAPTQRRILFCRHRRIFEQVAHRSLSGGLRLLGIERRNVTVSSELTRIMHHGSCFRACLAGARATAPTS
jgi:Terminase small subunit